LGQGLEMEMSSSDLPKRKKAGREALKIVKKERRAMKRMYLRKKVKEEVSRILQFGLV